MKVAVVGCGALGSYYGARLLKDGHEVHFLLRSDYDVVKRRGVHIRSDEGDFTVRPRCARTPEEIGVADLVLIGLKTTANEQFPRLLPPLVGPHTAVLTLQNGLGNEAALARLFPAEQILGGLCAVCLNRTEPGVIHHLAHGRILMGEFQRYPEPRTHDIAGHFRHSGVPCKVTDNLAAAHWEKLTWNIPFNGLGVASTVGYEALACGKLTTGSPRQAGLTTDLLLRDERWLLWVRELMAEVIAIATAEKLPLPADLLERQIQLTMEMGPYRTSTLIDFEHGLPIELDSLFREPLRHAHAAGVPVPRLNALCSVLEQLDAKRAGQDK